MGMISKGMEKCTQAKTRQCTTKESTKDKYVVEIRGRVPFEEVVERGMRPRNEKKNTNKVGIDISRLIMEVEQGLERFQVRIGHSPVMSQQIFVIVLPMLNLMDRAEQRSFQTLWKDGGPN